MKKIVLLIPLLVIAAVSVYADIDNFEFTNSNNLIFDKTQDLEGGKIDRVKFIGNMIYKVNGAGSFPGSYTLELFMRKRSVVGTGLTFDTLPVFSGYDLSGSDFNIVDKDGNQYVGFFTGTLDLRNIGSSPLHYYISGDAHFFNENLNKEINGMLKFEFKWGGSDFVTEYSTDFSGFQISSNENQQAIAQINQTINQMNQSLSNLNKNVTNLSTIVNGLQNNQSIINNRLSNMIIQINQSINQMNQSISNMNKDITNMSILLIALQNNQSIIFNRLDNLTQQMNLIGSTITSILTRLDLLEQGNNSCGCNIQPCYLEPFIGNCGSDSDRDGVPNIQDKCPNSRAGELVDNDGCDVFQICSMFSCGTSCTSADFRDNEGLNPNDCITAFNRDTGQPVCVPTTCAN